ncbi:alanine/ornithine racemase family PLP-dependent enzyme [Tateyamaria pelophila]|uniref:alanine/ornithine racemase family PLP-dependent enzyme n=1 Tax=Tateyamaria pelophila TaxID=328415 RepID=UPI001CBEAED1|nr:alanine/ornithine racemase family PLP-dependent enzyme [Tateyamaria pelophila]
MSCPRIEIDLSKIHHNTLTVVGQLKGHGIDVTGVTKAVCGHPAIARAMLNGGVKNLAEARLSNLRRLRKAGVTCPITLIRSPMLSQANDVVHFCETSYNTERAVIAALAAAAIQQGKVHGIILMVEMGDLREGIMPQDLGAMAQHVVDMPGVALKGIGANFACLSGTAPDAAKMRAFSILANDIEGMCGPFIQTVSGGNSANLPWAFGGHATGRINDLRLGEALLLGCDPVSGNHIAGLHRDAFTLVAEVIETDRKAVRPPASVANPALARLSLVPTCTQQRLILALGHQDTDIFGLSMPPGHGLIGATSDHLVIGDDHSKLKVGSEVRFHMNYSALMRAMAAPDVATNLCVDRTALPEQGRHKHLALV